MSTTFHETTLDRVEQLHAVRDAHKGDSGSTQSARLLAALHTLEHVTTYEAMRYLDIYDPRARKLNLKNAGIEIVTTWRTVITESGDKHRIGVYSLARGVSRAVAE